MGKLIALVGLIIAACAAYFSIYGLAHIYVGAFVSVIIMGSVLEVGKLVTASFLYRYWDKTKLWLKTYLLIAMVVLMAITSFGTYSYLSNAYQLEEVDVANITSKVELLDSELESLEARKKEISEDIGRIGANYISKRMELIDKYAPEQTQITQRISEIRAQKIALNEERLTAETDTGLFKIKNIARVLGMNPDDVLVYLTLLLVIVFDPLAVALTVAANIVAESNQKKKNQVSETDSDDNPPPTPPEKKPVPDIREEPEVAISPESPTPIELPKSFDPGYQQVDKIISSPLVADTPVEPVEEKPEVHLLVDVAEEPLEVVEQNEENQEIPKVEEDIEERISGDKAWKKHSRTVSKKRRIRELGLEPSPRVQSEQDLERVVNQQINDKIIEVDDKENLTNYADQLSKKD